MKKNAYTILTCLFVLALVSGVHARTIDETVIELGEIQPLSVNETMTWLEENAPEIVRDLDGIRAIDPELHAEMLMFASEEVAFAVELGAVDPEALAGFLKTARMEVHSEYLAVQYLATDDAGEKKRLKKELSALVVDIFDARMEELNAMIKDIEAELEELKATGEKRDKNRSKIIDRRINELLSSESEDLEWW